MGIFYCIDCDRAIETKTVEEAIQKFDHAISLSKGRKCTNDPRNHRWNGNPIPGYHPDMKEKIIKTAPTRTKP